ncbi:MAG: aldo/keto reductase [Treponema sp.]|nr:aldo/keto reductase [Treponema sp.]
MQYRTDSKSGNRLSVLGFGCMRLPRGIAGIDMRRTEELIGAALDGGVNFFDTAWLYPGSEEALGTALARYGAREKAFIQTKLPIVMVKGPADFDRYFEQSLQRLKTDHIDYYLMHMITDMDMWLRLKGWGIEEWIAGEKRKGRIRQIGFSFHGSLDDFMKVLKDYDWEACQIQYNYFDENFQAGKTGLLEATKTMPVFVMEPLLGGKLATNLPRGALSIFRKADPGLSPAAWALNWVWNQSEVTLLLSGMNAMDQLRDNLSSAGKAVPGMHDEATAEVYRRALAVIKEKYKIRCTGCNYCMPCPKGVNIPACFSAYNTMHAIGYTSGMQQFITSTGLMSERSGSPSQCVACGKCEHACPQKIPIIASLTEVKKRMEPFWLTLVGTCARAFLGRSRKKKPA